MDTVQASEEEIKTALRDLEGVCIKDEWFVLDQDYQMKVLSYILRCEKLRFNHSIQTWCFNKSHARNTNTDVIEFYKCIQFVVDLCRFFDENSWSLDCVKKSETVEALSDLEPSEIVSQVDKLLFDCRRSLD